jgi:hypothetical protein
MFAAYVGREVVPIGVGLIVGELFPDLVGRGLPTDLMPPDLVMEVPHFILERACRSSTGFRYRIQRRSGHGQYLQYMV